jgi:L-fuculose-phosphate aldolase
LKLYFSNLISGVENMLQLSERQQIVEYGKKLLGQGLTHATGGNLSICNRREGLVSISPSGMDYFDISPGDVPVISLQDGRVMEGAGKPSTELSMHMLLYRERPEVNSVVHTHSISATVLSCMRIDLPAIHYLLGFAGGKVPCAAYAPFGTDELAENALQAMGEAKAVLLANHGLLACGCSLDQAFNVAEAVEFCSEIYCRCRSVSEPVVLSDKEMETVIEKFKTYGRQK